ncbi:hypothetical protein EJ03DRAFT_297336 [Teratosphaeria nubilosa]|uniref:protein-histidine N-methyltransferase n=1 Tax=Teratosphaeria nubilosa TaxID=161662 RepID=A0A6G1L2T0_9PEZI|nr:hypothetical protein EJ03DRAFT_297336 [Teratosphaeria nubilosa]
MSFSFGFGSDDDAQEEIATEQRPNGQLSGETARIGNANVPVKELDLEELLTKLPDHISYSTIRIESPTGKIFHLAKRDLYDVKVQLLQEATPSNDAIIDQIEQADIRSGVYEGGFKTWECSLDLASLLLDRGPRKDIDELIRCDQIIELGAGSAIPTLVLFQHALANSLPITFTLADYNDSVLRLVTLPNILLTWLSTTSPTNLSTLQETGKSEIEITPDLIQNFKSSLQSHSITIRFLSGPWCSALADLIPASAPEMGTVILAAETIYSPESTKAFVELVCRLLKRVKMSKAMVAAKRMYFGVGGSVDGLKAGCREEGAVAYEIENHGVPGLDGGVGRALVEVQMY